MEEIKLEDFDRSKAESFKKTMKTIDFKLKIWFTLITFFYLLTSFIQDIYLMSTQHTLGTKWVSIPFFLTIIIGTGFLLQNLLKNKPKKVKKGGCSKCSKKNK